MPKADPRIDAYIRKTRPFAQPILTHIRGIVHRGCPDVEETLKWGHPSFSYRGILCGFAAFKAHAAFGFWKHALLTKQLPKVDEQAMGQFGCLTSVDDLPSDKVLLRLVKSAVELNEKGVKVARVKTPPKPPVKTPPDLSAAFKQHPKARATYAAFSPSNKREYVDWLTEAKTATTRARRLTTAIEWMNEGKIRNWKYC